MIVTHIKFTEVRHYGSKSGKCTCGKHVCRKKMFSQTLNPFNKNSAGVPKSRAEILIELKTEATIWESKRPVMHERCEIELASTPGGLR